MKWILRLTVPLLLLVPRMAFPVDLTWSTGSTSLEFSAATRCTLIVRTDGVETSLPSDWRLLWTAENCEISPIPIPVGESCPSGTALVTAVGRSTDAAGILGHELPVELCTPTGGPITRAQYVLDLPEASRGKFEVVALDPSDPDSMRLLVSPVAAFNGGLDDSFPPVFLRTHTEHHSTSFILTAVGAGLASAHDLSLAATDASWQLPISISSQTATTLTATAQLAANVPECLAVATSAGGATIASVPADPLPPPLEPESGCQQQFIEDKLPPYTIQAKDFAFVPGGWTTAGSWTYHLFYIRKNQLMAGGLTEKNLGHAVSESLETWTVLDTMAIMVRAGRFDSQHVWAPTIVRKGLTYNMLYTGVDDLGNQRIGLATSTDLNTWVQQDSSVYDAGRAGSWVDASPGGGYNGVQQFRDPYVMEDPAAPGHWLMYFVTVANRYSPAGMVVGVAGSDGDLSSWHESQPIWSTHYSRPSPTSDQVESPHAFFFQNKWRVFFTAVASGGSDDSIMVVSHPTSPTDTTAADWSQQTALQFIVPPSEAGAYNRWHATEYLAIGDVSYFAGFNDLTTGISYTQITPADPPYLFSGHCPSPVSVDDTGPIRVPRLLLVGAHPARAQLAFRVELPAATKVRLAIYDVRGRRVRTLLNGPLAAGAVRINWDGRNEAGASVSSGLYFASLTGAGPRLTARAIMLR